MADTRCANPEYQLDVDEMTLEYLVWNTLTAHIVEWEREIHPGFDDEMQTGDSNRSRTDSTRTADTLLAILDSTIHLFKTSHPSHPFTPTTSFYLSLLEFLLLLRTVFKRCGLTSESQILSDASHAALGDEALRNAARRWRCWSVLEDEEYSTGNLVADRHRQRLLWFWFELQNGLVFVGDENPDQQRSNQRIQLVDLLPRFLELSAMIVELSKSGVSDTWLSLAREFMTQAALEICGADDNATTTLNDDEYHEDDEYQDDDEELPWARRKTPPVSRPERQSLSRSPAEDEAEIGQRLLECFGWGLPLPMELFDQLFTRIGDEEEAKVIAMEKSVHAMLRSAAYGSDARGDKKPNSAEGGAWDSLRSIVVRQFIKALGIEDIGDKKRGKEQDRRFSFGPVRRKYVRLLQRSFPVKRFEMKLPEFIKGLQAVWVQMHDEPILRQIEQGRLEGLDDAEFRALMDRVGGDEQHEAEIERIVLPSPSTTSNI